MYAMLAAGRKLYSELMKVYVWTKARSGMGSLYRSDHQLMFASKCPVPPHTSKC
jgi:hypothetical protein